MPDCLAVAHVDVSTEWKRLGSGAIPAILILQIVVLATTWTRTPDRVLVVGVVAQAPSDVTPVSRPRAVIVLSHVTLLGPGQLCP
jgi:hypothetical protein